MKNRIYLSPPHVGENEKKLLNKAFDSNWIAPVGPDIDYFENEMSSYLGVQNCAAISSGTAGLHLSLVLSNVKQGDIVLCPSLTFAASANVIMYEKAIPVFIDVDESWTISTSLLEKAIKKFSPKALISVNLYGQSANYSEIVELCNSNNIFLIEDAAESLGSEYNNQKSGTFGEVGVLSFNGNKIITTSSGGMLVSDNDKLIKKAKFLSTQAREKFLHYEHCEIGYNYRMSNLLAAVGRGQLLELDKKVKARRKIFNKYYENLHNIEGISFMPESFDAPSNRWLTVLTLDSKKCKINRDQLIKILEEKNIESRPVWKPMHMQPIYKNETYLYNDIDLSKFFFETGLCLPSGSSLTKNQQDKIIQICLDNLS
tara:strand:+ start:6306 stop:7421 length:1116 start_codon:yes stop_codon:yes gene_type:complete